MSVYDIINNYKTFEEYYDYTKNKPYIELWNWADRYNIPEYKIPRKKQEMAKIKELDLGSLGLTYLHENIILLNKLRLLNISNNNLTSLPNTLTELKSLDKITISLNNQLKIDSSIFSLSDMTIFEIDDKQKIKLTSLFPSKVDSDIVKVFRVEVSGKFGLLSNGILKIPIIYDELSNFAEEVVIGTQKLEEDHYLISYLDTNGLSVIKPFKINRYWSKYNAPFSEGLAVTMRTNRLLPFLIKYRIYNKCGKIIFSKSFGGDNGFQVIRNFHCGRAAVGNPSESWRMAITSWGFIDTYGNPIVPTQYIKVGNFSEGVAAVCDEKGFGFIDIEGNIIIPQLYSAPRVDNEKLFKGFTDDYAIVCKLIDNKFLYGLINKKGEEIFNLIYDDLCRIREDNNLFAVKKDDVWKVVDLFGNSIFDGDLDKLGYELDLSVEW